MPEYIVFRSYDWVKRMTYEMLRPMLLSLGNEDNEFLDEFNLVIKDKVLTEVMTGTRLVSMARETHTLKRNLVLGEMMKDYIILE